MVEQGTRVDRLVSIDVAERFEALQDEVDLLKNEIKQTLVDLREHMMKGRTVFSQPGAEPQLRMAPLLPPRVVYTKEPAAASAAARLRADQPTPPAGRFDPGAQPDGMDPAMLGNVICWLGNVKQMGLSLQQVTPFLEAYEASGYLPPIMLKVLLRSLADLDQLAETPPENQFSPEQYADCIGQLHDIICAANIVAETPSPPHELPEPSAEVYPPAFNDAEVADGGQSSGRANGRGPGRAQEPAAEKYNLTTIRVPDPQDEPGFPESLNPDG